MKKSMGLGCKYGTHRVLEPEGAFPQSCLRIDNDMSRLWDNEILVDVELLNIDAASFYQISDQAGGNPAAIAETIERTVAQRGKQHNPVTGSGGMFTGRIAWIGPAFRDKISLKEGDAIASLVSLSLTPLKIDAVEKVIFSADQVRIKGRAVLFEKTAYELLPVDMSVELATAVFDVAGAPAQTAKLVQPGQTVLVVGAGGKSGLLCSYVAQKLIGPLGKIIGMGHSPVSTERIREAGFCDEVIQVDATHPKELEARVSELTKGQMADLTLNCTNAPDTELACILSTKPQGVIYFFNMATNFNRAALGAEGIGSGVTMIIGNGYVENHAEFALGILRENPKIMKIFEFIIRPR